MAVFAVNSTAHAFRHEQTEYFTIVPTTYTIRIWDVKTKTNKIVLNFTETISKIAV